MATPEKTEKKTGRKGPLRRANGQVYGGNPGCKGGTGRPPNYVRAMARNVAERYKLLEVMGRIAAGDIEEEWFDKEGEKHSSETRNADRIQAAKVILPYADAQESGEEPPGEDGPRRTELTIHVIHGKAT